MIKIEGKGNISATIIADSTYESEYLTKQPRITTFELIYPRFIHSEILTHRLFSRNSASSRAIPVEKQIDLIRERPAMPIHWGRNKPGMSADEENTSLVLHHSYNGDTYELTREEVWGRACSEAIFHAKELHEANFHKQIVNRLLEPFIFMKTVLTATEYDNFFYLRCHKDAQPELRELAGCMYRAYIQSKPEMLQSNEWHVPYVRKVFNNVAKKTVYAVESINPDGTDSFDEISLENALKISASCCAQVSYRRNDDSLEKALTVFDRLVSSKPVHASPFEHQAKPMQFPLGHKDFEWEVGVTHSDRDSNLWSGNFKGFIQHRQLIEDNTCWEYK